jgi:hypothetical protein
MRPFKITRQSVLASRGMARQSLLSFPPPFLHNLVPLSVLTDVIKSAVVTEVNLEKDIRQLRFNFCAV